MVETFGHPNEPTNRNSIKFPKVVKQTNKKTLLQNFGDQCNKQPMFPSSLSIMKGHMFFTIKGNIIHVIILYFKYSFYLGVGVVINVRSFCKG